MPELTPEQHDHLERFLSAFNVIDAALRRETGVERDHGFGVALREYHRRHALGGDFDFLRVVAELRNVLVHGKTEPHRHVAVPAPHVVERLEGLQARLANRPRAIPHFTKKVQQIQTADRLAAVLRLIAKCDYSQFPVYDGTKFKGLLTENGITRWLATHVTDKLSLVDLEDVAVRSVMKEETQRPAFLFFAKTRFVDEVKKAFATHELLEVVFFTETGKRDERLIGLATRWDITRK